MMRSLFSGVTALRNHQTRMDVIGNNIANVNTVGFKKSRVTFQDIMNQTIRGASSPQGGRGGTNPMQVGLGMNVATIETVMSSSSPQGTGKNSDLAISGDGFFLVTDGQQTYYTRAGNFDLDTNFNFYRTDNGMKVMGIVADSDGNIDSLKAAESLNLASKFQVPGKATTNVALDKNLNAEATEPISRIITIYDSRGGKHDMEVTFTKTANPNEWSLVAELVGRPQATTLTGTILFKNDGTFDSLTMADGEFFDFTQAPALDGVDNIVSPADGYKLRKNSNGDIEVDINSTDADAWLSINDSTVKSYFENKIVLDLTGLTQYTNATTLRPVSANGYSNGDLQSYSIDASGVISGKFSNGQSQKLAQVIMASFSNPAGLLKVSENLFLDSNNSGLPDVGLPTSGSRGSIIPGALEMSNVDLAQEFTDMITTQRGFQANNRIITVSDSMLEELVNLKR